MYHVRVFCLFACCSFAVDWLQLGMTTNDVYLRRGDLFFLAGDTASALEDFDLVLRRKPDSIPALRGRGAALMHVGRFQQAQSDLQKLLVRMMDSFASFCCLVGGCCSSHRSGMLW